MPWAVIIEANCAALGAINGTGLVVSESSVSTSTNCAPGNVPALEVLPARADAEHRHRIKGDMDRATENTEVGLQEMRREPLGFDQKLRMVEVLRSCCHVRPSCRGKRQMTRLVKRPFNSR